MPSRHLRHAFLTVAFLATNLIALYTSAQRSLLGGFDLNSPGAVIVTVSWPDNWLFDSDGQVIVSYFDDPGTIKAIDSALVVEREATVYPFACFDAHQIYACRGGVAEVALAVSENCHQIRIEDIHPEQGWNSYDSAFAFIGYFPFNGYKAGKRRTDTWDDRAAATAAWKKMRKDSRLLFVMRPSWETWDGTCEFRREHLPLADSAAMQETRARIATEFPGVPFKLEMQLTGANWKDDYSYYFTLRCPATMGSRFNIWPTAWHPFRYTLESYWRE